MSKSIKQAVEKATQEALTEPPRRHLGMSILGRKCPREIWYSFRWAYTVQHTGRMLRLFDRGRIEEPRFIRYLELIGATVLDEDPATGKQWHAEFFGGHLGGSGDGILTGLEQFDLPGRGLGEFKTHNDKSFKKLESDGVFKSKPEHYVQMQLYMHSFDLKWALYCAVNKNDDDLYFEVIFLDERLAAGYIERARDIILSAHPPDRISNDPTWWECKFCEFREVCHKGQSMRPSCRTCTSSSPTPDGRWACSKFSAIIPMAFEPEGCEQWTEIPE